MSTISGLGSVNRSWDSGASRKAEHEARMFAKADSDGSGGVDATELGAMLEHAGQSGDSAELLKQMDGDGDGSLSSDELSQGLRELMPPPSSTLDFAQARGAANDEADVFGELDADGDGQLTRAEFEAGRPSGPPPGGMPPPAASGTSTSATSTEIDPLDLNQDGTVSEIERLAGELKALAQSANDETAANPLNSEIAQLAQKLYDQIARNWLQPASTATQVSTTA